MTRFSLYLRWIARLLAAAIAVIIIALFIAHVFGAEEGDRTGLTPTGILTDILFFFALVGYPLGWRRERLGGWLIVLGLAGYFAFSYIATGQLPDGWFFPLMVVPGVLYLISSRINADASVHPPDSPD